MEDDWQTKVSLLIDSPAHKFSAGLAYAKDRFNASFSVRWVDEFLWAVGPFRGPVESYTTVDLSANYNLTTNWTQRGQLVQQQAL